MTLGFRNTVSRGETKQSLSELSSEALANADLVVIACSHTNVDYEFVQEHAKAIFDTKNAMKNVKRRDNIEVL